jgi:hypothetical protein
MVDIKTNLSMCEILPKFYRTWFAKFFKELSHLCSSRTLALSFLLLCWVFCLWWGNYCTLIKDLWKYFLLSSVFEGICEQLLFLSGFYKSLPNQVCPGFPLMGDISLLIYFPKLLLVGSIFYVFMNQSWWITCV